MDPTTPNLEMVAGKVFTNPHTLETYGAIRAVDGAAAAHPASTLGYVPFAEDGCGNAFVQGSDGSIRFWDHETDGVILLADGWGAFVAGCHAPQPIELDSSRVESVWIDPDFAKKFGLKG